MPAGCTHANDAGYSTKLRDGLCNKYTLQAEKRFKIYCVSQNGVNRVTLTSKFGATLVAVMLGPNYYWRVIRGQVRSGWVQKFV